MEKKVKSRFFQILFFNEIQKKIVTFLSNLAISGPRNAKFEI